MANHENQGISSAEQSPDVEQFGELAHERREAMRVQLERNERRLKKVGREQDKILLEASALADETDRMHASEHHIETKETKRHGAPSKQQRERAFKRKMESVQDELRPSERIVSKVIHIRPIEKASDFIGSTIARPNAMLSGSIAAFIGVTTVYFISKHFGFPLSGFETIAAFIIGWIIGVIYDYVSVLLRKR